MAERERNRGAGAPDADAETTPAPVGEQGPEPLTGIEHPLADDTPTPKMEKVFVPLTHPVTLGNGATAGPSETVEVDVNDPHNAVLLAEGHIVLSSSIRPGDDAE